jgi:FKBP-type peptidyl-prolyl cis-trans isomerase FkpA
MKNFRNFLFLLSVCSFMIACGKSKTPSGYAFKSFKSSKGATPKIGDMVVYDVILKKDDSTMFSSLAEGQAARMPIQDPKTINDPFFKMITEGIMMMSAGDSAMVTLNVDTMKVKPAGLETGKKALVTMMVRKVVAKSENDKKEADLRALAAAIDSSAPVVKARNNAVQDSTVGLAKAFAAGTLPANVVTTPSGLKILVLKPGTGVQPKKGQMVLVNYYGALKDGKKFDNSFERGQPINFPIGVGQVIPGWDEGVMQLKEGATAVLFVPAALGYGERAAGAIPANSDLVFYVELVKVIDVE